MHNHTTDFPMTRKEELERYGYIVVKNILTSEEIRNLRETLRRHFEHGRDWLPDMLGKHQPNATVKIPEIAWISDHSSLIAILREVFGTDGVVFTGNSDAHYNMINFWHKDLSERHVEWFRGGYLSLALAI